MKSIEKKYLVTVEFRYSYTDYSIDSDGQREYTSNKTTLGVYKDISDACNKGNEFLLELEGLYKLNVYANGVTSKKLRLTKFVKLVTNLGYLKTPFEFYLKVTTLNHVPTSDVLNLIIKRLSN